MTDWIENLKELGQFYERPRDFNDEQAADITMGFLVHAPDHVAAAKKLMLDIGVSDVFQLGAVETDTDMPCE